MELRLKGFILWFLIAALPLQGFAAALRVSCGPRQQVISQVHLPGHYPQANAMAEHDHHAMMYEMVPLASANAGHAVTPDPINQSHKHASAFCSTCGNCCIGGFALPSQISLALPTFALLAEAPHLVTHLAGFIPDRLDRPPRHTAV